MLARPGVPVERLVEHSREQSRSLLPVRRLLLDRRGVACWPRCPRVRAAAPITRAEYEACQARDEQGFRRAVEALTLKGLETGLANLDYRAIVADEWRRGNLDDIIDRQVDRGDRPSARRVRAGSSSGRHWRRASARRNSRPRRPSGCIVPTPSRKPSKVSPPASARRSASASSWPSSTPRGPRRNACRPSSAAATGRPSPASSAAMPARSTASIPPRPARR